MVSLVSSLDRAGVEKPWIKGVLESAAYIGAFGKGPTNSVCAARNIAFARIAQMVRLLKSRAREVGRVQMVVQRKLMAVCGVAAVLLGACSSADIEGSALAGKAKAAADTTTKSDDAACTTGATVALTPEDPTKYPKCACAAKGGAAR